MPETAQASRGKQAKARIRQAFTKLLREKPIQRIAVKELCQEAGVNRSTFYAHYQDIYDLLTKIEEDMLEDFRRAWRPCWSRGRRPSPPWKSPGGFTAACRRTPTCAPSRWGSLATRTLPCAC